MKKIYNWQRASVADIESDALLDNATKLHVLSFNLLSERKKGSIRGDNHERVKGFFQYHIDNEIPIVMHNGIGYDIPLAEKILGIDLSKLMIIDSLSLSWYLNTERQRHGLDSFHEDYGIEKPKIDDWENLSFEEYKFRCDTDVEINVALWEDFKNRLIEMYTRVKYAVDDGQADGTRISEDEVCFIDQYKNSSTVEEYIDRILTFLMFKADCARLKEETKWKVDVESLNQLVEDLSEVIETARVELEGVMPQVPQYSKKNKPAKPFKKDGSLSASGISWNEQVANVGVADKSGNSLADWIDENTLNILKGYEPPNINSHIQIKDFLFSKGWKPQNFKFVKDEEAMQRWADDGFKKHLKPKPRAIPQVSIEGDEGKQLCPSVERLAEKVPEIMAYAKYTTIKHRLDMCKGFQNVMREGGYLCARVGGYTNTLREMHRELVNLPSVNKPYGKNIRGLLIAGKGKVLMGSDMSGLEDRVKHHFMMPHDPDYVSTMSQKGYDPHLAIAVMAGLMTQAELELYKELKGLGDEINSDQKKIFEALSKIRAAGKSGNYACLPMTTKVLTKSGWKIYEDISEGDVVVSYNPEKGICEDDVVLNKHFFKDKEMFKFSNDDTEFLCTSEHRWHGWKNKKVSGVREKVKCVFTASEFNQEHNILATAPYVGGGGNVPRNVASLFGWLLAEGYWKWSEEGEGREKQGISCSLSQSNWKYHKELESLLEELGAVYTKSLSMRVNGNNVNIYKFQSDWIRDFLQDWMGTREDKHKYDWTSWVLSLSRESLEAFYEAFYLGDGNMAHRVNDEAITQLNGNICEAVVTAIQLLGQGRVSVKSKTEDISTIRKQKVAHLTLQRIKKNSLGIQDSFCLTTRNGSFIIMQDSYIGITGNCQYGSGADTLARTANISLDVAKKVVDGYNKLNWAIKAVSEEQCVILDSFGKMWLVNPINGFAYSLRGEKDRFSTLCQGTGSFFFDMWVDLILDKMYETWKVRRLTGQFHDEFVQCFKDTEANRETMRKITEESIEELNGRYNLRRNLGCDVQFGERYADIH